MAGLPLCAAVADLARVADAAVPSWDAADVAVIDLRRLHTPCQWQPWHTLAQCKQQWHWYVIGMSTA